MDFAALAQQCAATVHPQTMAAVVRVESGFNPFAIGVVGGRLERQPVNQAEAVATAKALEAAGYNFSVGLSQVNRYNLARFGLDYETAFDACSNLRAGAAILKDCFDRAKATGADDQPALQAAFSCYYSGNFSTGFRADFPGQPSYVQKVLNSASAPGTRTALAIPVVGSTPRREAGKRSVASLSRPGPTGLDADAFSGGAETEMVFR
jgi:type IV secretion system protein VirB1